MLEKTRLQKVYEKRQLCALKQNEKELEINAIEKQLDSNVDATTDLSIIKHFLKKKFGFDLQTEKAEIKAEAEKLKQEIRRLRSEAEQYTKCLQHHHPGGPKETAEKNQAICEKCKFQPFYVETAEYEATVAKRLQQRLKQKQEDAKLKAAKKSKQ